MFSPESTVHTSRPSSIRNPRRRQRKDSGGSLRQEPQRKRSKLSEETFARPSSPKANGNGSALMNGHATRNETDGSIHNIPVREKKTQVKRIQKDDGSVYLTKNANFSVKKLPNFPPRLCKDTKDAFRASALSSNGYALALTHDRALAWDYTSASNPTKVHTLQLPFNLKRTDPLPLGAVVKNGTTSDFGLVIVTANTGKITFWENVDSAEARSHFPQRHQGVDGSVGKIFSGEAITEIVDIEHAGYILIFSSGRLAQLTLRDSQGRPNISVNFISHPGSGGGFFGLKGILGVGPRKAIASVKARTSESKGQMEVITATKTGLFQLWDLSWSGQHIFKKEIDIHADILATLNGDNTPETSSQPDVTVLDFDILRRRTSGMEMSVNGSRHEVDLLVLVALSGPNTLDYALLEVDLVNTSGIVRRAIPLHCYKQLQTVKEPTGTLLLPYPGHTAFVQLNDAIVVSSLSKPEESPDAQLMSDSGKATLPYQDTIYFRKDSHVQLAGCASEDLVRKDKHSSCLFFIRGYGIIQLNAFPPTRDDTAIERQRVTARSKLEQATFFSTLSENILDFSVKTRYSFNEREVEEAARDISRDILTSSSSFVEVMSTTMEEQIKKRSAALRNLMIHLRSDYPGLPTQTRWSLLNDAEKCAAALQLWKTYDERVQRQHKDAGAFNGTRPLLPHIVDYLHERYKTELRPELGEMDAVRQYFVKDINRLEILVPWAFNSIKHLHKEREKEHSNVMQLTSEADDITLSILNTAFDFREENVELYGLNPDDLEDGVLKPERGYESLPPFWTSTHNIINGTRQLIDFARKLAFEYYESGGLDQAQASLAMKIAMDIPRLIKVCCQIHTERYLWCIENVEERTRALGHNLKQEFENNIRRDQILALATIGQTAPGMDLAEKYRDMQTLVKLVWNEVDWLAEEAKDETFTPIDLAKIRVRMKHVKERIQRYFTKYGDSWADPFYDSQIGRGSFSVFEKEYLNQPALTKYLRKDNGNAKLGWINEIIGEKSYEAAGAALNKVAQRQESNAWCKKVELSLGKLALLCGKTGTIPKPQLDKVKSQNERGLQLATIQDLLYDHVQPTAFDAMDDDSAIDLVMDKFGKETTKDKAAQNQLLRQGFEQLLRHRVMAPGTLIDVLTLMDRVMMDEGDDEYGICGEEYWYAFQVLNCCWPDMDATERESFLKIIWKRCYIRDEWEELNNTTGLSDDDVKDRLRYTTVLQTMVPLMKVKGTRKELHNIEIRSPSAVLGAGCTSEELARRFPSEDLRGPIINNNISDDDDLQYAIEHYRLAHWFDVCKNVAKDVIDSEMREELFEEERKKQSEQWSLVLLNETQASDTATEAPSAFDGDDEQSVEPSERDKDGDVEMGYE